MEIKDIKHDYKLEFRGDYLFTEFRDRLRDFKPIPFSERLSRGIRTREYYRMCKQELCARTGVYFLYNTEKELVYIGASRNLGQRCSGRINGKVVMYITSYDPFEIEEKLIKNYKPKNNIQYISK